MAAKNLTVLGIETSCDDTAAALVDGDRTIRANLVLGQAEAHRPYGGVVPEIAARAHLEHLDGLIARAMDAGETEFGDLDGVAATAGPGLIGGVIVGVMTAKAIAAAHHLPFIGVNHLEAHALTARLVGAIDFPYLLLLVSGGHCQILIVRGVGAYEKLGATIDDAVGEAFDKVAKLLGLAQPGGPAVEREAAAGDATRFALPRPLFRRPGCDFSFSGLKTAVRHIVVDDLMRGDRNGTPTERDRADLCASFQAAVGDCLVDRVANAFDLVAARGRGDMPLVVAGGVAANRYLHDRLAALVADRGETRLVTPPAALCTDNAAMVAWAGIENLRCGRRSGLDLAPRPRWPLEELCPADTAPSTGTPSTGTLFTGTR